MAKKLTGLDYLSRANGTKRFGVETINGAFSGFTISQSATIITVVMSGSLDITSTMGLGAGKNLYPGEEHCSDQVITSITCSAGSGVAIKGLE